MAGKSKAFWVGIFIKILVVFGVSLWLVILMLLATSELPMLRQLLGCMLTTMAIFGVLSLAVSGLKQYANSVEKE